MKFLPASSSVALALALATTLPVPAAAAAAQRGAARDVIAVRADPDLRRALDVADQRPDALVALARARSPEARARIATVLALLGHARAALALSDAADDRALVRATRALAAGDTAATQADAWRAFTGARDVGDQRYALALAAEAARVRGDLAGLATLLATRPASVEARQALVDTLLELGRTDAAIAVVERAPEPELRGRLLAILLQAGRMDAVAAEYRRRIAARPGDADPYTALAALLASEGRDQAAVAVFEQLFAANPGRSEVLIAAARAMVAMGLDAPALAMIARHGRQPGFAVPAAFFLFETRLDGGDVAGAMAALDGLRATLPAGSPVLADVADGYERLGRADRAYAVLRGQDISARAADYDQRVRLAQLADRTGQGDEALARWRALWAETTLPARRGYLEKQVIRAARKLGRLDAIVAEQEARLSAGRIDRAGLDLLVAVRIEQGRAEDAEAAVERYAGRAGLAEKDSLDLLGAVQARTRSYAKLDATLRRLIRVDPANADAYLRRLILNLLRTPAGTQTTAERQAAIDALLRQAAANGTGAGGDAFAAGIYALAGRDDRAVDAYRRAAAADPAAIDPLLQLTAALKKQGKRAEAAALLLRAADTAAGRAAFLAAIDGLVDLFAGPAGPPDDGAEDPMLATDSLRRARQRVLERIVGDGDAAPYHAVLADLAQAADDFDMQIRAYDTLLPIAGDQRAAVLRQLIALTTGSRGQEGAAGAAIGDPRRKLDYGRRLVALRREYPADVYADIARTMLAAQDGAGAERAFALMSDMGGLVNVDALRGDAYADAGPRYVDRALASYGRALARDHADPVLATRLSILHEQRSEDAIAFPIYWQAVRRMLLRGDDQEEAAMLAARRNWDTLIEGLLLTWPVGDAAGRPVLDDLDRLFTAALADAAPPFVALSLIGRLAEVQRRIGEYRNDRARLRRVQQQLATAYVRDPASIDLIARAARRDGIADGGPDAAPLTDAILRGLAIQAADAGNTDLQLTLAFAARDERAIAALVQDALAREARARAGDALARDGSSYYGLIRDALAKLPDAMIVRSVLAPLDAAPFRDEVLFDVYRAAPDSYARIERLRGRAPLSDTALLDLTTTRSNAPLPSYRLTRRSRTSLDGLFGQLTARFSIDQQIGLYERFVAQAERTDSDSAWLGFLRGRFLRAPLTVAQRQRFAPLFLRDILRQPDAQTRSAARAAPGLLIPDAEPGNRPLLLQAARMVADRYPDGRHLPELLGAWFAGRTDEAFRLLLALSDDTLGANYGGGDYATTLTARYFLTERQRAIDAFLADPAPDAAATASFYRHFVRRSNDPVDAVTARLRRLVELRPDILVYRVDLLDRLWQAHDLAGFVALLAPHVAARRDDREAASVLQIAYRMLGQAADARSVASASGVDVGDTAWLLRMTNLANVERSAVADPDFRMLFGRMQGDYFAANPADPAVAAVRGRIDPMAGAELVTDGTGGSLAAIVALPPGAVVPRMRALWRNSAIRGGEGESPRAVLIRDIVESGPVLVAAMRTNVGIVAELDRELRAMAPADRRLQQPLYDLLAQGLVAQGLVAQGVAPARLAALTPMLLAGTIGAHDLQLLATLADRLRTVPASADIVVLSQWLRTMPILSIDQRILFAGMFARAQAYAPAEALLTAAALQTLYPERGGTGDDPVQSLARVAAELASWADPAAARRAHGAIAARLAVEQSGVADALTLPPLSSDAPGRKDPG